MKRILLAAAILAGTAALPAAAQQQSQSYKFLQAVKDAKGDEVTKILDQPGQRIINTRDVTTGDGALHIVIKRGDDMYLRYLLSRGADPNLRNGKGDTPLLMAIQYGQNTLVDTLLLVKANPNLANSAGETPLIRAVQRRDLPLVRVLLAAGADPDMTDNVAGMSARDYAHADSRSPAIAKLIDEKPKTVHRDVAGPKL
ncbi:ankyrin repeat domain-containing protein [Sphingomonas sp. CL5.1]|uniref:ankyrin repeat domain-containing protein n=1 Tax=Sphingomonas sp. CL5.1 TaxID=2653203 RepID=UPI00158400EE|nr:ankyrin repeat domain-containing protein [Sphingomonas sp. CL5.1]QKR99129.1 ankyrin repeat domain-containing protein [Sphingomonas sp. CL5.1]